MAIERWVPSSTVTPQERFLLKRLGRVRKLFGFLREHRALIFDDQFQDELAAMYRDTGAGIPPVAPALMAMAALLQGYVAASDAEVVELTVVDLRWQMVLGRLGQTTPAFSQGAFYEFRNRLIRHDLDRRLLERTTEVARKTRAFDWRKLPKDLRVAIDSRPLEGAGRVEDTFNLLAHAARKVLHCAAELLHLSDEEAARRAQTQLLIQSSVKKALDIDWSDDDQKADALDSLVVQIDHLQAWVSDALGKAADKPPLSEHLATLAQIRGQDLEPDPTHGGKRQRIRDGVAPDRRISIEDGQMRHGRKSNSRRVDGYKQHIAIDLDTKLILACAVTPANRPEADAAEPLKHEVDGMRRRYAEWHMDRGYIKSPIVAAIIDAGGEAICKPWMPINGELFPKSAFKLDLRAMTITCPAGQVQPIRLGHDVQFDANGCRRCSLRSRCTKSEAGRSVLINEDERLQQRLRKLIATKSGRARLRQRVAVEHSLAHIAQRQRRRARYRGIRKNLYDLRRASAIQNLETTHRRLTAGAVVKRRTAA
jgi:Transposase DDE domain/Transposase domain (DUF772)